MNNDRVAPPKGLLGLRNRERPERQPYGAMADMRNMDVTDSFTVERRAGYALAMPLTAAAGAYALRDGRRAFVIDSGDLILLRADLTTDLLASGLPQGEYWWAEADDLVFYTGAACGWIRGDSALPLRIPVPQSPTVTAAIGSLPAGLYQATLTLTHIESGIEGAAAPETQFDLVSDGALRIQIPALDAGHTGNLYLSSTNGDVLYALVDGLAGGEVIEYNGPLLGLARPLEAVQRSSESMPDGITVCEVHEGRLYVAQPQIDDTTVIWFSQPGWYHLFDVVADFEIVPGIVTGLASVRGGLVVATTKEISLLQDRSRSRITWYGTPAGQPLVKTPYGDVYAWTERGVIRLPEFANLTEAKVSLAPGGRCVTAYVEQRGREQMIVCTDAAGWAANPYY